MINKGDREFAGLYNSVLKADMKRDPHIGAARLNTELNTQLDTFNLCGTKTSGSTSGNAATGPLQGIVAQYLKHPYPVQFLLIVSPMVAWLWAGALIIVLGGLTSLIPASLFRAAPQHLARARSRRGARARLATPARSHDHGLRDPPAVADRCRLARERARCAARPRRRPTIADWEPTQRLDLEAARDAKYREIRDAELDHQTGKLSEADYEAIDSTLRAEAIELLHRLDAIDEEQEPGEDEVRGSG